MIQPFEPEFQKILTESTHVENQNVKVLAFARYDTNIQKLIVAFYLFLKRDNEMEETIVISPYSSIDKDIIVSNISEKFPFEVIETYNAAYESFRNEMDERIHTTFLIAIRLA